MDEILSVLFTGILAFASTHYTLAVATVKEPLNSVISAVFAVLVVVIAGAIALAEIVT
jgi:hypothetical protein